MAYFLLSNTYANKALDAILGTAHSADFPANVFVGLSSTKPADDGTGITEPVIGTNAYARVSVANTDAQWPDATSRRKSNAALITFPTPTGAWLAGAQLKYFLLFDAATAGAHIIYGALRTPRAITAAGSPVYFAIGDLAIYAPTIF